MLTTAIQAASRDLAGLSPAVRDEVRVSAADTLAVLAAGWDEPATLALRQAYPAVQLPWDEAGGDPEARALVWGMAAHALDYDDVHMTSVTHASAVLIPAILAVAQSRPEFAHRRSEAFALGLAVNVALGETLGFDHYDRGWHATSTIGSVAAGAAVAHLLGLGPAALGSALGIAAAQSSGLQRSFGTMVKPLQAGFAAAAGVRAGLLAEAGVTGPEDVFGGDNGFFAVFGKGVGTLPPIRIEASATTLSRKLFSCCYLAHRPAAAALDLRRTLPAGLVRQPDVSITVTVPPGCLKALTVVIPETGMAAKFSGQYIVAHALWHGSLGLGAFDDAAVLDPDLRALARRVTLTETPDDGSPTVGIDRGTVEVAAWRAGQMLGQASVAHYPGSPAQPITEAQLTEKIIDCARGDQAVSACILELARGFAAGADTAVTAG